MNIIIAGSRKLSPDIVDEVISLWMHRLRFDVETEGHVIFTGDSGYADKAGNNYAERNNWPLRKFPPNWNAYGKSAGPIRNAEMIKDADALILIWDGESRGSANIRELAEQKGIPIYETIVSHVYRSPGKTVGAKVELY